MTKGRVVVTGAASGIGLAATERLLGEGWAVAAIDRDPGGLAALAGRHAGARLSTHALDLTDGTALAELARDLSREPVAGLVNSAGIGANERLREATAASFRRVYEINVVASFALAQALLPAMEAAGGGSVVNIASVSGMVGNVGRAAYGASKGAMIALTKIMAVELAPVGIRVNAVSPGPIETAMVREMHDAATRQAWLARTAMRRYGQPEEIAGTIHYLLDPSMSSYVTGQVIAVDGGFTATGLLPEH